MVAVFCLLDDLYKIFLAPIKKRGSAAKMSDAEVITLEFTAQFLGFHTGK